MLCPNSLAIKRGGPLRRPVAKSTRTPAPKITFIRISDISEAFLAITHKHTGEVAACKGRQAERHPPNGALTISLMRWFWEYASCNGWGGAGYICGGAHSLNRWQVYPIRRMAFCLSALVLESKAVFNPWGMLRLSASGFHLMHAEKYNCETRSSSRTASSYRRFIRGWHGYVPGVS